jgi:hypothetical protein
MSDEIKKIITQEKRPGRCVVPNGEAYYARAPFHPSPKYPKPSA